MTVNDELAEYALTRLAIASGLPKHAFRYEIQDDFQSLYISVAVDQFSSTGLASKMRCIAEILRDLMPVRDREFSWIVGFLRHGHVVESCFGGNSSMPGWDGERFMA